MLNKIYVYVVCGDSCNVARSYRHFGEIATGIFFYPVTSLTFFRSTNTAGLLFISIYGEFLGGLNVTLHAYVLCTTYRERTLSVYSYSKDKMQKL
jgi:hypothetical protein